MRAPPRDHYIAPSIGPDSHAALDAAIESLAAARNLDGGDAGVALHLLASLLADAHNRLPKSVGDAREQGCSWAEIADLLGITRASAWQRFAGGALSLVTKPPDFTAHPGPDARPPSPRAELSGRPGRRGPP
jgi:hypothetical protein